MAMSSGSRKAEMNVTPMIDVLLVLIIIFLVVTTHTTGLRANIPQNPDSKSSPPPMDDIVISVVGNGTVRINQEIVALADLQDRLRTSSRTPPITSSLCDARRTWSMNTSRT